MKARIHIRYLFLLPALFLTAIPRGEAQEVMKHPRVIELEDKLNKDASNYIKSRFPDVPFMVSVRVDPLRRDLRSKTSSDEGLPYYDGDDEDEIKDEWDNPQVPLMALINRVKRVQVSISVPARLSEADVSELKQGIVEVLHLTPARDQIELLRRDWTTEQLPRVAVYLAGAILTALLAGLLVINRSSANRIAKALAEVKFGGPGAPGGGAPNSVGLGDLETKSERKSQSQELKFNDPIKMKELATRHIQLLTAATGFPNRRDIFILDRLGRENPEKLGAILGEFPADRQRELFSFSSGYGWVDALNEPGFLDFECLEILQNLTQIPRDAEDRDLDHAVLAVWRLNDERTSFVKSLPREEAFALLANMPKAVAVAEARKAFPGAWAAILDPEFAPARLPAKRLKEIQDAATRIVPLNDIKIVERYRAEKELLEYLRTADPSEERDIYGAAVEDSLVHRLRPPFFPIFDQPAEVLQWFVPRISTDQWALALFNLPKSERAKIDTLLPEKHRYLLIERWKRFDAQPPDRAALGTAREHIGAALRKYLAEKAHADQVNLEISTGSPEDGIDTQAA